MSTPLVNEPRKKGWFDGTVNLPTIIAICTTLASLAYYGINQVNSLQLRVSRLEDHDTAQEQKIADLRVAQNDLRNEIRDQLKGINDKLDRFMYDRTMGFDRSQQNGNPGRTGR